MAGPPREAEYIGPIFVARIKDFPFDLGPFKFEEGLVACLRKRWKGDKEGENRSNAREIAGV